MGKETRPNTENKAIAMIQSQRLKITFLHKANIFALTIAITIAVVPSVGTSHNLTNAPWKFS